MGVGEAVKEQNVIVETFAVASGQDITLGSIVVNDGSGLVPAGTSDKGPFFMAMAPYDHTKPTTPDNPNPMPCLVVGIGDCLAVVSAAAANGQFMKVASTGGAVDYDSSPSYGKVVGIAMQDFATTDTHGYVLFGHR